MDLEKLKTEIRSNVPGFEVRYKNKKYNDDPWRRYIIDFFGKLILGDKFLNRFATTIYPYVYLPDRWDENTLYKVLRHEYVHLLDEKKYGWLYRLSYVLALPSVFTMRSYWELRAYRETLRVYKEQYGYIPSYAIDFITSQFTGPNYLWMDPVFGEKRVMKAANSIEKDVG